MLNKLFNQLKISDHARDFMRGAGSVFCINMPVENLLGENSDQSTQNSYKRYNYRNPTTVHDYWKATGNFLSIAMSSYGHEQVKTKKPKKK